MTQQSTHGVNRQGLNQGFEEEEARKSNLILTAQLMRAQQRQDEAAANFAQAARIEERLSEECESKGLLEKSFVHRFSAASCCAQAGDFYHAIALCDDLLARADLPERLRQRVMEYAHAIRIRRDQWYEEMILEAA
ncbi:MAG: hypothetical protein ACREA2_08750 [Blastocatellia bacterium]